MQDSGRPRLLLFALGTILVLGGASPAEARVGGIATSCGSCHQGGQIPKVTISMSPMTIDPGGTTTVTVSIPAVNGGVAGVFLHARGSGTFQEVPGEGTRLPTTSEVVHAAPKRGSDVITFQTRWTAPAKAGSYSFEAWGVSANGNNALTGDGAIAVTLPFTVGCEGLTVYGDFDGDGYGSTSNGPSRACSLQPGFVLRDGDCNDYRATVYPGAREICDEYDNDCNGKVNEGLEAAMVYRDADGDGHGGRVTTDTRVGCDQSGYSTLRDDCNDNDKDIYAGAKEICNNKDDNCNGRIDEGARLSCGTGWCRSVAESCASTACTPGEPRSELCNLIDDDCDGVVDNAAPCEGARVCVTGRCLQPDDARAVMEAQQQDGGAVPDGGGAGGTRGPAGADNAESRPRREQGGACSFGIPGEFSAGWLLVVVLASGTLFAVRRRQRPTRR